MKTYRAMAAVTASLIVTGCASMAVTDQKIVDRTAQSATAPDPGVSTSSSSLAGRWPARANAALQRSAVALLVVMPSGQFV